MYQITKENKKKEVSPWIGIGLLVVSILLSIVTLPFGLVYGLLHTLFTGFIKRLGEYCMEIATIIDQQGNVIMQHLLNLLWIKGQNRYTFGDRDETISSALGKNQDRNTLTCFGKAIVWFLDKIDPNHSLNSIEYYVQRENTILNEAELDRLKKELSNKFGNVDFSGIRMKGTA
jgi:8-oxo-dGTP diphosphatase